MERKTPYLEIDLKKIRENVKILKKIFDARNISIMGVTKLTLGDPLIAQALIDAGITILGDSRLENIKRMKEAGIQATFVLIRMPALSEIENVGKLADISLNSELEIIRRLSKESIKHNKKHGIILMVEMGDLREGVMPEYVDQIIEEILSLEGIHLEGIGTNLKCFAGVIPDEKNTREFSELAKHVQKKFDLSLRFVSGGNSANYDWFMNTTNPGVINNLRLGTALLLGVGGVNEESIPNLHQNAFQFAAEIVQIKEKPGYPIGKLSKNAFGEESIFLKRKHEERKTRKMALLNAGRQDIIETKLHPLVDVKILGATSDYIILDLKDHEYNLGDEIRFILDYEALLNAMTSPFVSKYYVE
ncbi:MAG: alanine/ornithine racemase family PLP-dependent enzyme [Promethearchaeota archaeon]